MKKLLISVLAALLLAAVTHYATLWYGAHSTLSEMKQFAGPWGDLHWDRIRPGFDGSVSVEGVRWHWFDVSEPVTLKSVSFSAPGFLPLHRWLLSGEEPSTWELQFNEVELVLQPDLFRPWARVHRALSLQQHPLHLERCGNQPALTPADLLRMGIDRIGADAALRYRGPTGGEGHGYSLSLDAGLLGSLSGQWQGERLALPWSETSATYQPGIHKGEVVMRDAGFMRRLSSFCAAAEDEPVDEWVLGAARDWSMSMKEQGMSPSTETTNLFQSWLREGGELALEWNPAEDFQAPGKRLTLAQWQEKAGLSIVYNDRQWESVGFAVDPDKPDSDAAEEPLVPVEEPDNDPKFRASNTERAAAWIDRRVRLDLANGRRVEGQLVALEGGALHIRRTLEGGEVVAPFHAEDIETFSVWRRPDDPGRPITGDEEGPGLEEFLRPGLGEIRPVPTPVEEGGEEQ
ncbi:hypothetical protein DES49_2063 [Halospina denitrificans]|uniref:Uncharacterized protein n=1 Tax=Halospina denitrificans TaxID=332522 RepID=A0A4R7JSH9_9GAMM|nr:hypothetical protein [Halospina denitrificans]TDT40297.1 hypothetical protein DES49_2063 [Halospina denitrificans]